MLNVQNLLNNNTSVTPMCYIDNSNIEYIDIGKKGNQNTQSNINQENLLP